MRAIVLTFDGYRPLADHMIFKYAQLWPHHPFQFRMPYQQLGPTMATGRVEYKQCPRPIKATVLALLDDLDDEEMVYWCIDDKYPVKLDVARIAALHRWLSDEDSADVSGVLFCRCRRMWDQRCLTGHRIVDLRGNEYLERSGYEQIWLHQFLRVKVLRSLFLSFPDEIPFARHMDDLRSRVAKPLSHRLFVSRENLSVFGESTERGTVTRNCRRSILANGLALPSWSSETTKREFLVGTWSRNLRQRARYSIGRLIGRPPDFFY